jgi:hypothetical protein
MDCSIELNFCLLWRPVDLNVRNCGAAHRYLGSLDRTIGRMHKIWPYLSSLQSGFGSHSPNRADPKRGN